MRDRIRPLVSLRPGQLPCLGLLLALGLASGAQAWKDAPGGAMPIKQALEIVEIGDYFVVEGVVRKSGQMDLYTIEDDSGQMLIYIPEFLRREHGTPEDGERIRVSGKFDQKKLDRSTQGMRVSSLRRLGHSPGFQGEAVDPEHTTPRPTPSPPAARAAGEDATKQVFQGTATEDFKQRASVARRELEAARKELEQASQAYARALYDAGEPSKVDPAVAAREQAAEKRLKDARAQVEALVEEGRKSGVDADVIDLYEEMTLSR